MNVRILLIIVGASFISQVHSQPLVVHEWGTFTSLQDERGRTLSGINTDDEPVPGFCHDLAPKLILSPNVVQWGPSQGAPRGHREVTMRLETPVIYFHPAKGAPDPLLVFVKVAFRGGWLTQFYPQASVSGFHKDSEFFENLTEQTTGVLKWENLKVGAGRAGPQTTERVWTAPRAVEAATVTTTDNESEKFLFYRGVGHLDCPLQVVRTADSQMLEGRAQPGKALVGLPPMTIRWLWLASFRANGACAFQTLAPIKLEPSGNTNARPPVLFSVPGEFAEAAYSAGNLDKLRREMRQAMQEQGLFGDEADALLNTWELSYFKSPGLRLFFMVPSAWTDFHLPMEISPPAEVNRVMVGRLELVTPAQRTLLNQLAHRPTPTQPWVRMEVRNNWTVLTGDPPPLYHDLGRFRNALVLDEYARRPTESLARFISLNQLEGFGWTSQGPSLTE